MYGLSDRPRNSNNPRIEDRINIPSILRCLRLRYDLKTLPALPIDASDGMEENALYVDYDSGRRAWLYVASKNKNEGVIFTDLTQEKDWSESERMALKAYRPQYVPLYYSKLHQVITDNSRQKALIQHIAFLLRTDFSKKTGEILYFLCAEENLELLKAVSKLCKFEQIRKRHWGYQYKHDASDGEEGLLVSNASIAYEGATPLWFLAQREQGRAFLEQQYESSEENRTYLHTVLKRQPVRTESERIGFMPQQKEAVFKQWGKTVISITKNLKKYLDKLNLGLDIQVGEKLAVSVLKKHLTENRKWMKNWSTEQRPEKLVLLDIFDISELKNLATSFSELQSLAPCLHHYSETKADINARFAKCYEDWMLRLNTVGISDMNTFVSNFLSLSDWRKVLNSPYVNDALKKEFREAFFQKLKQKCAEDNEKWQNYFFVTHTDTNGHVYYEPIVERLQEIFFDHKDEIFDLLDISKKGNFEQKKQAWEAVVPLRPAFKGYLEELGFRDFTEFPSKKDILLDKQKLKAYLLTTKQAWFNDWLQITMPEKNMLVEMFSNNELKQLVNSWEDLELLRHYLNGDDVLLAGELPIEAKPNTWVLTPDGLWKLMVERYDEDALKPVLSKIEHHYKLYPMSSAEKNDLAPEYIYIEKRTNGWFYRTQLSDQPNGESITREDCRRYLEELLTEKEVKMREFLTEKKLESAAIEKQVSVFIEQEEQEIGTQINRFFEMENPAVPIDKDNKQALARWVAPIAPFKSLILGVVTRKKHAIEIAETTINGTLEARDVEERKLFLQDSEMDQSLIALTQNPDWNGKMCSIKEQVPMAILQSLDARIRDAKLAPLYPEQYKALIDSLTGEDLMRCVHTLEDLEEVLSSPHFNEELKTDFRRCFLNTLSTICAEDSEQWLNYFFIQRKEVYDIRFGQPPEMLNDFTGFIYRKDDTLKLTIKNPGADVATVNLTRQNLRGFYDSLELKTMDEKPDELALTGKSKKLMRIASEKPMLLKIMTSNQHAYACYEPVLSRVLDLFPDNQDDIMSMLNQDQLELLVDTKAEAENAAVRLTEEKSPEGQRKLSFLWQLPPKNTAMPEKSAQKKENSWPKSERSVRFG